MARLKTRARDENVGREAPSSDDDVCLEEYRSGAVVDAERVASSEGSGLRSDDTASRRRPGDHPFTEWTDLPLLLDADDVALLLRTSRRAIYQQHQRGQLPAPMDLEQRRLLWDRDAVLEWLGKRRAASRGDPR